MGLYMLGFISYGATLVFYAAAFPRLARNTPYVSCHQLPLIYALKAFSILGMLDACEKSMKQARYRRTYMRRRKVWRRTASPTSRLHVSITN